MRVSVVRLCLQVRSASQGNRTFLGYCCYHWHYGAVTDADSLSAI